MRIRLIFIMLAMVVMTGCPERVVSADEDIQRQQEKTMQEAAARTGLPAVKNFQEKKMLKMLYELRDREDLGKCIGYGLPASTQYSNPEKRLSRYESSSSSYDYNMPQAEPNGLFMPEGLSATWLMMVDPETNEPRPVYIEPAIIVSPFKL